MTLLWRLTYCDLVTPYGDINLGQAIIWSNGDLSSVRYLGIHLRQFHRKCITYQSLSSKITNLILHPHLPREQWVNSSSVSPAYVRDLVITVPADVLAHVLHASWWRHQMETFSALLAICAGNSPVSGEFPAQRPVTRSFDVFFDLRLNKRSSKQSWGWWFETPSRSLCRQCKCKVGNSSSVNIWGRMNDEPAA